MIIASVNVNGIRAAVRPRTEENVSFSQWLNSTDVDVVLLQEVRANEEQTREALGEILETWHIAQAVSQEKGRSGVAILSKAPLEDIQESFPGGERFTGRYIQARTAGIIVASLYLPSGSTDTVKQDDKYEFMDAFYPYLREQTGEMLVAGDWNICHRREDLKNWKGNRKKSGFLPDERSFMDKIFGYFPDEETQINQPVEGKKPLAGSVGDFYGAVNYTATDAAETRIADTRPAIWFDAARECQPEVEGPYTWWSNRGQAFETNTGWRIDYHALTEPLRKKMTRCWVDKAESYEKRWSDHAPVLVEIS